MRIGELAELVGVSTRTVRHYHQLGVLPEPARRSNGYRQYGMRDAVILARVRRLVDLGLSLEEVRDVVADEQARDLPEILTELDADLAEQEHRIRQRRSRLAELLEQARSGALGPDDVASPELVDFLKKVDVPTSKVAAWDRDMLLLLDGMGTAHGVGASISAPQESGPELIDHSHQIYRELDALAEAETDDPRIPALAGRIAQYSLEHMITESVDDAHSWSDDLVNPFVTDLAPAQAEVIRQVVGLIAEHDRQNRSR